MITPEVLEKIESNASIVAGKYQRRCWWVSKPDLVQEAKLAQLVALKTFDEARGTPLGAYLWSAALYAVRTLVHKDSAPVSYSHRVEKLQGLHRATLFVTKHTEEGDQSVDRPELTEHRTPEHAYLDEDFAFRVRSRVSALVGDDAARFALAVLTGEWHAADIVEQHGGDVKEIYAYTKEIRAALNDRSLYELWKEA